MSYAPQPAPTAPTGSHERRPRWPALAAWWRPAPDATEPVLGYESALPWVLPGEAPAQDGAPPY